MSLFLCFLVDGDKDKEDIRRGIIGADDAGGRQKLLRTIRSGKYKYPKIYIIIILLCTAKLKLWNLTDFILIEVGYIARI